MHRRSPSHDPRTTSSSLPALLLALLGATSAAALANPQAPAADATATAQAQQAASPVTALAVVDSLQRTLLSYMGSAALETPIDRTAILALDEAVLASHDFPYIARIVLGRTWRQLEEGDRERFVERFTALSLTTYANRFAQFAGERFDVVEESDGTFGQRRVSAQLITAEKEHGFDYLLREDAGQWRIVNIIVDGVSDLALKRAEYSTLIADEGFEGLLSALERQRRAQEEEMEESGGA